MRAEWRKSSHSHGVENSDCVELADLGGLVAVRDGRAVEAGRLAVSVADFAELVRRIKAGELDLRR
ncbi:DUF397 domain-containing protein [Spirillospora sp. NPDC047279]|uniref:DUF397 domain-containing protein n=1 Tax=Spirillospora sp. NPDC047279 TaxID=3155478 RepID=UPI0033CD9D47